MEDKLLNVEGVANLLGTSPRTVWRFRDSEKMPQPIRLGGCIRWRISDLAAWIAAGCPDMRRTGWTLPPAAGCAGGCKHGRCA